MSATGLERFSPIAQRWFAAAFAAATPVQQRGWEAIARGEHALLLAPTGSGKTLAAFLWCLDQLAGRPLPAENERCRVLYISPLKALSYDVERNLLAPLAGMRLAAAHGTGSMPDLRVATRTGDTPANVRRDLVRHPPDILITTPESLYLMLTSQARAMLASVRWVIVDEIHSLAGTKRGAHLALSLERLEALVAARPAPHPVQRIGLSATVRPLDEVARFLGGAGRPVTIVDASSPKRLDLEVIVPVEDLGAVGQLVPADQDALGLGEFLPEVRASIWPSVHHRILDLIEAHRSTLVFVNSRRLAERMANRLNELWEARQAAANQELDPGAAPLVYAHHGSIARERRQYIEESLKAGTIRGLVATSSLELGIDMGAIDLVIQVEAPPSVASGLQRIGRGGHQVDAVSVGKVFPKYRGDLVEAAVVVERMARGLVESIVVPRNPLDVLAQQVVAMCIGTTWSVEELLATVRRAYPYAELSDDVFGATLDMLAGRYPSDEFAELKPRIVWDREANTVTSRGDARLVAVTSGGTIPDRGLFPVVLGEGGPRLGELDEENVYEMRPGQTFLLGASSWRIQVITPQQVIVQPAPGEPGQMPFWRGDQVGRPVELGIALGAFTREIAALDHDAASARLQIDHFLDPLAAENLLSYLEEEREATGALPTDRTIVVERFRDELGDWRVCVLTPFGGRVHAPWSLAIERRLTERLGAPVHTIWSDDGIAIRLPEAEVDDLASIALLEPDEIEELVVEALGGSALFATHFRDNAGRALLLPRRRPGQRTPLWLQRQRSAGLLQVASRYGSFPIILETYRECLRDIFDLPALVDLMQRIQRHEVRVHAVDVARASPYAGSLIFDYVAEFMYEGDAPLAERRAQALTLDRELLRDLLGNDDLRELLSPEAMTEVELDLQRLSAGRQVKSADHLHDLLRRLGDLDGDEVAARSLGPAADWLAGLDRERRVVPVRVGGADRWIAIEDAARYRDGLGVSLPAGLAAAYLGATEAPLEGLLLRWGRTHGPFPAADPAVRWGLPPGVVDGVLRRLVRDGSLLAGQFRALRSGGEYCDSEVLRQLKRRSLARLRQEIEPVPIEALGRFLPRWQGIGSEQTGLERVLDVVAQLEGLAVPASVYEREVLRSRVRGYQPRWLDELTTAGEIAWLGRGRLPADDGRIALFRADRLPLLRPEAIDPPDDEVHQALRTHLRQRGASFFRELHHAAGGGPEGRITDALWDLAWAGEVTNDTLAPLRALRYRKASTRERPARPRLARVGPPEVAGRWSLVDDGAARPPATQRAHALALQLLERYGVVTRESVVAEGIAGGFAAVYPVLRALEESGRARRGYFIDGLGGAQFALPGAVDRLRAERETGDERRAAVLATTDPANPWGASLPWPAREDAARRGLQRAAGALVVTVDGVPVLYVKRGGKALTTLAAADDPLALAAGLEALAVHPAPDGRGWLVEHVDGEPVLESRWKPYLEAAGFRREYLGLRAGGADVGPDRGWARRRA